MKTSDPTLLIRESLEKSKQYFINHRIPVVIKDQFLSDEIDLADCIGELESIIPPYMFENVEIIYIGDFPAFADQNAAFSDGAIYVSNKEVTNHDILEDIIHELAHAVDITHGSLVYDNSSLKEEFLGKRNRLKSILDSEGYKIPEQHYSNLEYSRAFDSFLSDEVGYPTLLSLTMGLFASPYGATSLQEYFANGFEKFYLGDAKLVKDVSPALYNTLYNLHSLESDN